MKFAASVSLAALALAGCAATPQPAAGCRRCGAAPTPAAAADDRALTAEGARAFVAAVEKDLFDSQRHRQPRGVGQRHLHQRRYRCAGRLFRHHRHRKGRQICHRGGAISRRFPGLDLDTARKLNILRGALVLAAPTTPGAAAELNTIATRLQSTYGKGRATPQRQGHHRRRCRGADGHAAQPGRARRNVAELARECRPADARRLYARMVEIANAGRQGARLCRHRRDVALAI